MSAGIVDHGLSFSLKLTSRPELFVFAPQFLSTPNARLVSRLDFYWSKFFILFKNTPAFNWIGFFGVFLELLSTHFENCLNFSGHSLDFVALVVLLIGM